MTYVFDACALIAFLNEEKGAGYETVTGLLVIDSITAAIYRETARFKALYSMSLADAFLCATAKSLNAVIVTKDSEIEEAEKAEPLSVFWIKRQ